MGKTQAQRLTGRGEARQLLAERKGQSIMMKWTLLSEQICYLSQAALMCFCCYRIYCLSDSCWKGRRERSLKMRDEKSLVKGQIQS